MADDELARLKTKLTAREGVPGYEENARELKDRITELERDDPDLS